MLLYVYDLSNGFAAQMSMALLGKQVASSAVPRRKHVTSHLMFPLGRTAESIRRSYVTACIPGETFNILCSSMASGIHLLSWMAKSISMEAEYSKLWLAPLRTANL